MFYLFRCFFHFYQTINDFVLFHVVGVFFSQLPISHITKLRIVFNLCVISCFFSLQLFKHLPLNMNTTNEERQNRYSKERKVGEGTYAVVYVGRYYFREFEVLEKEH